MRKSIAGAVVVAAVVVCSSSASSVFPHALSSEDNESNIIIANVKEINFFISLL